tara:strand:+ start:988 stop:1242 length:255 start_codon:yes stop_codon:yes gene_type:complete
MLFKTTTLSSLSKKESQKATIINTLSIRREITLFCGRGKLTKNFKNTIHFPEASNHIAILLATILLQDEQPMHLINKDYRQYFI